MLVPLFEEEGEARVVLTVRSDRLRFHQGEVAFPGGRLEGDESVVDGALREAAEEVGLDPGTVTVVAQLTAMPTISSDTVMTPVVATLAGRPALTANPAEVDRIFDVALSRLAADGVFHEEWWSVPGRAGATGVPGGEFPVWFFEVEGETVWGATARTLVELLCLVLGVAPPRPLRSPLSRCDGARAVPSSSHPGEPAPDAQAVSWEQSGGYVSGCQRPEVWTTATRR